MPRFLTVARRTFAIDMGYPPITLPNAFDGFITKGYLTNGDYQWAGNILYHAAVAPYGECLYNSAEMRLFRQGKRLAILDKCANLPLKSGLNSGCLYVTHAPDFDEFEVGQVRYNDSGEVFGQQTITASAHDFLMPVQIALLKHHCLMMHASAVTLNGYAYLFLAPSGMGKSTHTSLWVEHFGARKLNDDLPIVSLSPNEEITVFGSPWSGSTPCYINDSAPLGGLCVITQGKGNRISSISPVEAFQLLLSQIATFAFYSPFQQSAIDLLLSLVERIPTYHMHCLSDREAAQLSMETMQKQRSINP